MGVHFPITNGPLIYPTESGSRLLTPFISYLLALLLLLAFSAGARAQETSGDKRASGRVGLALSGGGAKGFAHIGILKVLEANDVPIHVVTGSSMGAIIGGLYAAGYAPGRIEELILELEWQSLFNDSYRPDSRDLSSFASTRENYLLSLPLDNRRPRLPSGLIEGRNLSMQLYRLLLPWHGINDFSRLPVSYAALATDLETGKTRRFDSGYLPEAIRASAAIPSVFKPVVIDGRPYIDGGVTRNIPVEDAQALGADYVLVSNVGEPVKPVDSLKTFVDVLFQAVGYHQLESDSVQIPLGDVHIRPDIEAFDSFSYDDASALIARGEEAARAMLPEILALLDSVETRPPPDRPEPRPDYDDPYLITEINYGDEESRLTRKVDAVLGFRPPAELSYNNLEQRIGRLYDTGLFSQITYRLLPDHGREEGHLLKMELNHSEPDRGLFSFRYDSPYKASLLFGARFRHTFTWGDQLLAEMRLGEIMGISAHYDLPMTLRPVLDLHGGLNLFRSPIDLYEGSDRLSTVEVEQLAFLPSLSAYPADAWNLQIGVLSEFYNLNEAVGNVLLFEDTRFLLNGVLQAGFNSFDRPHFPQRGMKMQVLAEGGFDRIMSSRSFAQVILHWEFALPLSDGIGVNGGLYGGHTAAGEPPLHYRYYLGGVTTNPRFPMRQLPLLGYDTQQLSGSSMAAARANLRFHLGSDFFLRTSWNTAYAGERWNRDLTELDFRYGWGLSLGILTLVGPAEITVSTPDMKSRFLVNLSVGYTF